MELVRRRTARFLLTSLISLSLHFSHSLEAQQMAAGSPAAIPADDTIKPSPPAPPNAQQSEEILTMLGQMRQELTQSRQEVENLRKEVGELRELLATGNAGGAGNLKEAVDALRDDQEVLDSQVKTLDQTKVGTESKYPLRITGMVLFNSFVVDGAVDNPILPSIALPRTALWVHHSTGATLEQTQLGLNANGPTLWNARTSADVAVDFFNSSYTAIPPPTALNLRLRTASVYLDWKDSQVSAGQQTPLITPLSPTSFATVGQPALAWAGNLWTWLPQATFIHRRPIGDSSHVAFGFGLLDPEAAETTGQPAYGLTRRNLQPGYEGRIAYEWGDPSRPYELGASGYYTRQLYYGNGIVENQALDFWAGTADWRVPILRIAELSGEFYRGRGLGDLGGGAFKNVVVDYGAQYASGLNATGGWAQWKSRLTPSLEVNAYFGMDNAQANQVRNQSPVANASPYLYLVKNQSTAANIIFRPKTYLVFSGEYRYLKSWYTYGSGVDAQTLNLTMGYLF
jgi:hypothetical protein